MESSQLPSFTLLSSPLFSRVVHYQVQGRIKQTASQDFLKKLPSCALAEENLNLFAWEMAKVTSKRATKTKIIEMLKTSRAGQFRITYCSSIWKVIYLVAIAYVPMLILPQQDPASMSINNSSSDRTGIIQPLSVLRPIEVVVGQPLHMLLP